MTCKETSTGVGQTFSTSFVIQQRQGTTKRPLANATVTETATGPSVITKHVTLKTDRSGMVTLPIRFGGPGTYTISFTVTKKGNVSRKGSLTVYSRAPANAPCAVLSHTP